MPALGLHHGRGEREVDKIPARVAAGYKACCWGDRRAAVVKTTPRSSVLARFRLAHSHWSACVVGGAQRADVRSPRHLAAATAGSDREAFYETHRPASAAIHQKEPDRPHPFSKCTVAKQLASPTKQAEVWDRPHTGQQKQA
ncbi:hypothetical protein AAFF_G00340790 [Aldrovandia affinis]|uniref:Uncharacterized protein n=1 Tax=Aldrovandia affinis TaxID=143900 RepID=A0AAD7WP68_9TELE|nr:hypothetical protein AAFF_G00340790 [Aldrovandia affinis]